MTKGISDMNTMARLLSLLLCAAALSAPTMAAAQARPSIAGLQAQITTLQSQVATGTIPNVSGYVTMDVSTPSRPTLRVAGANLQVVNGTGSTITVNGLGNVIVGYDEVTPSTTPICNFGEFHPGGTCTGPGAVFANSHKSGSHNVVVGRYHNYSRYGGIVAGSRNSIIGAASTVTGGEANVAAAAFSSITGGSENSVHGYVFPPVVESPGTWGSVTGGQQNDVTGLYGSISGGLSNESSGMNSSISGGEANRASNLATSVSGGLSSHAAGTWSSISGGVNGFASGEGSSISGGASNAAGGLRSSISGGSSRSIAGGSAASLWVGGNVLQPQ